MRTVTERAEGLTGSFILMGVIQDGLKHYGCILNASTGKIHIEQLHWSTGVDGNYATANLRAVEDDEEWAAVYNHVTKHSTILSPKRLKKAIKIAQSRGIHPTGMEKLVQQDFPYVNRKVDLNKKVTAPLLNK